MFVQGNKLLKFKTRSGCPNFSILGSNFSVVLVILLVFCSDATFCQNSRDEGTTQVVAELDLELTTSTSENIIVEDNTVESFTDSFVRKVEPILKQGPDVQPQILRKCSGSVKETFFFVPPPLQAHSADYQNFSYPHFQKKYGPYLYNFTLVDPVKERGRKVGIKSPCQDITITDEEVLSATANVNNTEVYLWLSLKGGLNVQNEWFRIHPDGYLIRNRDHSQIAYNPLNYCVARMDPSSVLIRVCSPTCSMEKGWNANQVSGGGICIPTCSRFGNITRITSSLQMSFIPTYDQDWAPLPPNFDQGQGHNSFFDFQVNNYQRQNWNCSAALFAQPKDGLWVSPTGKIYRRDTTICGSWESFDLTSVTQDKWTSPTGSSDKLCMDGLWNLDPNPTGVDDDVDLLYDPNDPRAGHLLLFCEHEPKFIFPPLYSIVQFVVFAISSVIHLTTLSVFLALWSQQNVHGFTIMTFCLAQFSLEFLEFLVRFFQVLYSEAYEQLFSCPLVNLCIALGALQQFIIISCFSWTTVLCFDIFSKIRSTKPVTSSNKKKKEWGRFGLYSIFGNGIPLVWTAAALVADASYSEPIDGVITPNFALTCFINEKLSFYVYISLPIFLLELTNLVLMFFTVKFVWNSKRNVQAMKDSASSGEDNSIKLIVKLCVMMGIFFLFDVVYSLGNPVVKISSYFVVLESYWILQAVATFWIFVWNDRMLKQLTSTYPVLQKVIKQRQTTAA